MPVNFANSKVYAIRSHQTDKIYIGSTTQTLSRRLSMHKSGKPCSSSQILQYPDCYIELLESYACANKNELNRREGELIRTMDCVNKNIAGRTDAEYRNEHKNEKHQYYVDNKTEINEKQHQKYNCFCGSRYTTQNKARHFKTANHLECIRQLSA